MRPGGRADWLTAVECFYGVGLVGGSALPYFVPLIKGRDIGGPGMSPLCMCFRQISGRYTQHRCRFTAESLLVKRMFQLRLFNVT